MLSLGQERQVFSGMMDSASFRRVNFPNPGQAVVMPHFANADNHMMVDDGGGGEDDDYHMWVQDDGSDGYVSEEGEQPDNTNNNEVTVEDVDDDEDIYPDQPVDNEAEIFQDFGMDQILGLDEKSSILKSDLELLVRDIVFPRVEIQVSFLMHRN
jgi:hypothetical protein